MTPDVTLRWSSEESDAKRQTEVVHTAWKDAYREFIPPETIEAVFQDRNKLEHSWAPRRLARAGMIVAVSGEEIVGLIGLAYLDSYDLGEVAAFYVDPQHQGQGIGTLLWNAGLGALSNLNCTSFEVWTLAQAKSRSFYEHHGCELFGEGWVDTDGVRNVAVGYRRTLADIEPFYLAP